MRSVQSLIEKCEVALHKDATGWHLSAKGAFGVGALLIMIFLCACLHFIKRTGPPVGQTSSAGPISILCGTLRLQGFANEP